MTPLEVPKGSIEASRIYIDPENDHPFGTEYSEVPHTAVCIKHGVLAVTISSCNNVCDYREGRHIMACEDWMEHTLFAASEAASDELPKQEFSGPTQKRVEAVYSERCVLRGS